MTDDSLPLVSSTDQVSSWNLDRLHHDEEDESTTSSTDFFSVLKKSVAKHVYSDEGSSSDQSLSNPIRDRSTIRIDSSDLISRCRNFLPLITDANRNLLGKIDSGENVRIELDSDEEPDENIIEMDLMFCPSAHSSSSSDAETSDDEQLEIIFPKVNPVNIVEIQSVDDQKLEKM